MIPSKNECDHTKAWRQTNALDAIPYLRKARWFDIRCDTVSMKSSIVRYSTRYRIYEKLESSIYHTSKKSVRYPQANFNAAKCHVLIEKHRYDIPVPDIQQLLILLHHKHVRKTKIPQELTRTGRERQNRRRS